MGHHSKYGGKNGDLHINVELESNDVVKIDGLNLVSTHYLTLGQAIRGTSFMTDTL